MLPFSRLAIPSLFCRRFWIFPQKCLEKSNTFLSASDVFLREPITTLASTPGALLAGLTQRRQGSDGKQPIAYRVSWAGPVGPASCAEENDSSLHRPTCDLGLISVLATAGLAFLPCGPHTWFPLGIVQSHVPGNTQSSVYTMDHHHRQADQTRRRVARVSQTNLP